MQTEKRNKIKIGDEVLLKCMVVNIKNGGDYDVEIAGDESTKAFKSSNKLNTTKIINIPPDKIISQQT